MNTPEPLRPPVVEIPAMPESEVDSVQSRKPTDYSGGWESEASFTDRNGTMKSEGTSR